MHCTPRRASGVSASTKPRTASITAAVSYTSPHASRRVGVTQRSAAWRPPSASNRQSLMLVVPMSTVIVGVMGDQTEGLSMRMRRSTTSVIAATASSETRMSEFSFGLAA